MTLLRHQALQTALWLVLAALLLDLGGRWYWRGDLTRDGRFGLSDTARDAVSALEKPLLARVYFSEGLEAPYHDHRRALLDLLEELSASSGGLLDVVAIDPSGDKDKVAEAAAYGVRPIPYAYRSWDRTEARTVYMGVSFVYGDRQVAVDALPSIPRMEYEVVRAIREVTTPPDERRAIGWLLGHGEPDPSTAGKDSPLSSLRERLSGAGAFRTLAPGDAPIPEDVDVLLIVAPREPVPAAELVHLDQYVMRGGAVLAFVSQFQADFERMAPTEVDHGLAGWLGQYGVRLDRTLLLDRDSNEGLVVPLAVPGMGRQLVRVNHPLAVVTTELDRTVRPVRDLPRVVLPFASTLTLADPLPAGVEGEVWVRSDKTSSAAKGVPTLDPKALRQPLPQEVPGPHPAVVALTGRFPSLFTERPLPPRTDPEAQPFDPADLELVSEPGRIVVVGSGDAVANNLDLVANAVDWLVEDPALIDIRARGEGEPALPAPPRGVALRAKLLMAGTPLLALALIGLWTARRARR